MWPCQDRQDSMIRTAVEAWHSIGTLVVKQYHLMPSLEQRCVWRNLS
jgi:hypothetical protein